MSTLLATPPVSTPVVLPAVTDRYTTEAEAAAPDYPVRPPITDEEAEAEATMQRALVNLDHAPKPLRRPTTGDPVVTAKNSVGESGLLHSRIECAY